MEEAILGFILSAIVLGVHYSLKNEKKASIELTKKLHTSVMEKSRGIIQKNLQQLAIQKNKSAYVDDYGKKNFSKWHDKEIPYFIENHIYPELNQDELLNIYLFLDEIFKEIEQRVKRVKIKPIGYHPKMNGFEFEDFCAEILKKSGWKVEKTKPGADQGIDLIIRKKNYTIGVQCKKYARPVGNKAVQQVKAGIVHYNLNDGIVLANNAFTKSAIELAQSTGIGLVHYLDVKKIEAFSKQRF
jgi:restriction system protein